MFIKIAPRTSRNTFKTTETKKYSNGSLLRYSRDTWSYEHRAVMKTNKVLYLSLFSSSYTASTALSMRQEVKQNRANVFINV